MCRPVSTVLVVYNSTTFSLLIKIETQNTDRCFLEIEDDENDFYRGRADSNRSSSTIRPTTLDGNTMDEDDATDDDDATGYLSKSSLQHALLLSRSVPRSESASFCSIFLCSDNKKNEKEDEIGGMDDISASGQPFHCKRHNDTNLHS